MNILVLVAMVACTSVDKDASNIGISLAPLVAKDTRHFGYVRAKSLTRVAN